MSPAFTDHPRSRFAALTLSLLLCASLLAICPDSASARKRSRKKVVPYRSAYLVEAHTGRVLKAHNPRLPAQPASIVKMMTTLIAVEHVKKGAVRLDEEITVSRDASKMGGQQVYLAQGEKFSLRDLLKSIIISSANDSSYAVAEHVAGDADVFVEMMNERARELGMTDTRFVNVNGLPERPGNRMSARDASLLAREIIKHPQIIEWSAIRKAPFRNGRFTLENTNKMVGRSGVDGLKTGYHQKAGFSIVATAKRKNLRLIAVVMGSSRSKRRFKEASRLLNWGFYRYYWASLEKAKPWKQRAIKVLKGQKRAVRLRPQGTLRALIRRGEEKRISMRAEVPEAIPAPVRAGQRVGRVVYELGGNKLGEIQVVAAERVQKLGFFQSLLRLLIPRGGQTGA